MKKYTTPESEKVVLSMLLKNERRVSSRVFSRVSRAHLLEEVSRLVYDACKKIFDKGDDIDVIKVKNQLHFQDSDFALANILAIENIAPTTFRIDAHINDLLVSAKLRAQDEARNSLRGSNLTKKLLEIEKEFNKSSNQPKGANELIDSYMEEWNKPTTETMCSSILPLSDVGMYDRKTLNFIAAYSSIGKSAFLLQEAIHIAAADHKVLFISLEMSEKQIMDRALSQMTGINNTRLKYKNVDDIKLHLAKYRELGDNFKLIFKPGISSLEIIDLIEIHKYESGLDAVFIDYLQIVGDASGDGKENETSRIAKVTKSLQCAAGENDIAIICASQLARPIDRNTKKMPNLSQMRGSGAIEQDADSVLILHREDRESIDAQIFVAKNRNGSAGAIVDLLFTPHTLSFSEL